MSTTHWDQATRATLYVRSDLPASTQRCHTTVVSRLEDLVAGGELADFSVSSWAKRVPLEPGVGGGEFERSRYEAFADWAADVGVRLTPFFDTRECYCGITGDRRTELVLPAHCLALSDGDDVVSVVPHATESETVGIRDFLAGVDDEGEERTPAIGTAD